MNKALYNCLKFCLPVCGFLLLFTRQARSQERKVKFNLVRGLNGVIVGKINSITQDPDGYIWFSDQTQKRITRYDGRKMISYKNDLLNQNSLGGTYPEKIFADPSGIIWIGFYGMGLDRLDPQTGRFTHYRHSENDPSSLASDTVTDIVLDRLGNLWIGGYGGLDLLDRKTGKFKHYSHNPRNSSSLSDNIVRAVYEDREGTLWVGTGLPWNNNNRGGLNRFERTSGTFTRFMNDPKNPQTIANNKVRSIFEDSKGNFWVGTAGNVLHKMNRSGGTFDRMLYNPANPNQLSAPPPKKGSFYDHITFIAEDGTGALWIATFESGINRYNPGTKQITYYGYDKAEDFKDSSGWAAYTSRDGVLWITTQEENVYRVNPFYFNIKKQLIDSVIIGSIYQDATGILWMGSDRGFIKNDRKKGTFRWYKHDPLNNKSISHNAVRSIRADGSGKLWLATDGGGLNRFDPVTETFTHYRHNDKNKQGLLSDTLYQVYYDKDGSLWIGSALGIEHMNPATGTFTHYQHSPKDTTSLGDVMGTAICRDSKNRLWLGSWNGGGLNLLTDTKGTFKHYLKGKSIIKIHEDTDGIIWVGTLDGLYKLDPNTDSFKLFTDTSIDLVLHTITSIIEDDNKNLWIGSSEGIIRLNRQHDEISVYDKSRQISNDLMYQAAYKGLNNELFFGGEAGYYNFFAGQLTDNSKKPEVLLSQFSIRDRQVRPGAHSPLSEPLMKADEIRLTHNDNVFSFEFAPIDYLDPDFNRVMFKLENYDNTWHTSTEGRAYYFSVPPGNYIFKVKAANSNGAWAEKEITVIITPPWWQTWWAYTLLGLLIIGSIWAFVSYRSRSLVKEKHVLEQKVKERTVEVLQQKEEIATQRDNLEQTLHELQNTQAQLVQREKMASLGELTAGIAHEIQNPLNFVNNFSEVSVELLDELKQGPIKELPESERENANEIINSLSDNLHKINHHGKRADAIVKGMLQHSRTSTGEKEPTDINALADEYLRLSYQGLRSKDKSFNVDFKTNFDASVGKIDVVSQDIGRVLLNLYNNAFYAAPLPPEGGFKDPLYKHEPTVWVKTSKIPPSGGGGAVLISIRDNGPGISKNIIDKIFQPFFTTKPTGQGTGLGLSLSYDIIKAHGGEIRVETKEGEGSEFIIQLPL